MLARSLLALFIAPLASAQQTFIVDDSGGPGVDFTDIQPAVDAAGPLDTIRVRWGTYSDVHIDHQVTMLGDPPGSLGLNTVIVPRLVVAGILGSERVVLTDLDIGRSTIVDSEGMVLVDGGAMGVEIVVERSDDVRLQRATTFEIGREMTVTDSQVQCVGMNFVQFSSSFGAPGVPAIVATRSSLILTECDVRGGDGGDDTSTCFSSFPGDGGPGISLLQADLRLHGGNVAGGWPGFDCFGGFGFASFGPDIWIGSGSAVLESDTSLSPNGSSGSGSFTTADGQPWFTLTGGAAPGSVATFSLHAEPVSAIRAFLGRLPVVVTVPGFQVPRYHTFERGVSLGETPPSGVRDLPWTVPALPAGTLVHVQGTRTLAGGSTELSNGVTLVVR